MFEALRYAVRSLRRRPGFALVATLTLGVGIGASSAVYSVVHGVLLRPLPFAEADRLVRVEQRRVNEPETAVEASYPDVMAWREELSSFEDVAAFASGSARLVRDGEAVARVPGKLVTWNFFEVLGVRAFMGRTFRESDGRPGAARVAVIHEDLWRSFFGGDPATVGGSVELEGEATTIVGVVPSEAEFPVGDRIWTPAASSVPPRLLESTGTAFLHPFGRLAAGVESTAAATELGAYLDRVNNRREGGASNPVFARLDPLEDAIFGDTRGPLLILLGATLLLVLVACANVANLQLVRARDRQLDAAVRVALGAPPGRLVRHALAESGLLAGAGGLTGLAIAALGTGPVLRATPMLLFRGGEVAVNGPVALFTVALAAGVALVAGVAPAAVLARQDPQDALRAATRTAAPSTTRTLSGLVMAQVTLAVTLLLGAALLGRSFVALQAADKGFDASTLTMSIPLYEEEYREDEAADRFFRTVARQVAALPGVDAAGAVLVRPLETRFGYDYAFTVEDRPPAEQAGYPYANYQAVTPGYFRAMGIELVQGRAIRDSDGTSDPPVAVVGESFARRFWDPVEAVGKRIKLGGPEQEGPWIRVVGVVEDTRHRSVRQGRLDLYVPASQSPWKLSHLAVRATTGDPTSVVPAIRNVVREVDPRVHITGIATMGRMVSDALARPRFLSVLLAAFAAAALLLGMMGLYGVLAYGVTLRTRELGIRMALGATGGRVRRLVVGWGLRLTLPGLAAGLGLVWMGRGVLESQVYGVSPADPTTYAAVALLFGAVAAAAAWLPAWRASRTDPGTALTAD